MCSTGAEANENALQVASFETGKSRINAFNNTIHGRSNAALASTDNLSLKSKLNNSINVTFLDFNDKENLKNEICKNDVSAVIIESIQGVGGLNEPDTDFTKFLADQCKKNNVCLIADEVQSGFGRTGDFFAFQKHGIEPDIISMAKGMGNGFPVGGVLISKKINAEFGMLGTTFGGNHLACSAVIAVLKTIENEKLMNNSKELGNYFIEKISNIQSVKKIKGRGLMLGLEFDFEVSDLRKKLIYEYHIFTGGAANKKLLRILPPLNVKKEHIDQFFEACHFLTMQSLEHL
jgi:acetylornithine aminotransferase